MVTGASSGIGREMATQLAAVGTELVVVARDQERLEELAASSPVEVEVLTADLSTSEGVGGVAERLGDDEKPIDLLVNNAGLGFSGELVELPPGRARLMVDVNVLAVLELCDAAGRAMVRRGGGTILNVSSIAGDFPGPESATYNATKAFVTSFSQSIALELKPRNVVVSCLCPGLTRTEFVEKADLDVTGVPDFVWQSGAEVAKVGLAGAAAGRTVVISGEHNRLASRLARTAPRAITRWVSSKVGT